MKKIKEKIRKCLYQRMDSFLVEGDKPRPIERLNLDRHLFVDTTTAEILELFGQARQKEKESKQLCPKCGRKMIDAIDWYICEPCWHKVIKT